MLAYRIKRNKNNKLELYTPLTGKPLLGISQLNKGTAFSDRERKEFNLIGKLPAHIESLEQQIQRAYLQFNSYNKPLNKNIFLNQLLNNNQVLFYALIKQHLSEMMPIIYTPIVGNAVQAYNRLFMQPRGLYICYKDRSYLQRILANRSHPHVRLLVISDGEGVLGIGDQGVGAMAIPVAKLMVYTALGGIDPLSVLPILLDMGTNNKQLLDDPLYYGWRQPRVSGEEYRQFMDQLIDTIKQQLPHVFVHWEDFGRHNAMQNLLAYQNDICSFNDDIQGTGVVALAACISALSKLKQHWSAQRIVIYGAGTAGMGIVQMLVAWMQQQGMALEDIKQNIFLFDKQGLLHEDCMDCTEAQKPYFRSRDEIKQFAIHNNRIEFEQAIDIIQPTILIGTSAQTGAFHENIIKKIAHYVQQPVIFPLSNPPERAEANPSDILEWTNGKAMIATGSPFPHASFHGKKVLVSQCNNFLAFPGIGLGAIACQASKVNMPMLLAASKAISDVAYQHDLLLPTLEMAHTTSQTIAREVVKVAIKMGVSEVNVDENIKSLVEQYVWRPEYLDYHLVAE